MIAAVQSRFATQLHQREHGPLHWFREWPNAVVPLVAACVYTVWQDERLLYVGMPGRGLSAAVLDQHRSTKTACGVFTGLASHVAGRRSGDQFCVYVADRLVLPRLTPQEIADIGTGSVLLDHVVRDYVKQLGYRFVIVPDGRTANAIETAVRRGGLSVGCPLLNPERNSSRQQTR